MVIIAIGFVWASSVVTWLIETSALKQSRPWGKANFAKWLEQWETNIRWEENKWKHKNSTWKWDQDVFNGKAMVLPWWDWVKARWWLQRQKSRQHPPTVKW